MIEGAPKWSDLGDIDDRHSRGEGGNGRGHRLVAFGNLTDYDTNLAFIQHVLSMDTIFVSSTIKYRAITDPALQRAAYALIIATEAATAVLCWIGAAALARRLFADAVRSIGPRAWPSSA